MKKQPPKRKPASSTSKALAIVRRNSHIERPAKPTKQELVLSSELAAMLAGPIRQAQDVALTREREHERRLADDAEITGLGLAKTPFSAEIEKVLAEPVDVALVSVKPSGVVFLSHIHYTRWFNRAFGRGAWALVPVAKVKRADRVVAQDYILYVHGEPRAMGTGEQEYFEGNRDQSWGDAIESTVASGLRRCAKRLGVGLELWDKDWIETWLHEHAVRVPTLDREGKTKYQWRKKTSPPFYNEVRDNRRPPARDELDQREERRQEPERPRTPAPPADKPRSYQDGKGDQVISDPQLRRLWAIIGKSGRVESEVKAWLAGLGYEHTKDIRRKDYDRICQAIEASGELGKREPGQEG